MRLEGTELVAVGPDGRESRGDALLGAVVVAADEEGRAVEYRIDQILKDPGDPQQEVVLYVFSSFNPSTQRWERACKPDPRGIAAGFALPGSWTPSGEHLPSKDKDTFTLTCMSGAAGKCVRFGYKPWKQSQGQPLADYHQACTRMVRADYCGNGESHTRNGTTIEVYDRLDIQRDTHSPGLRFEAGWSPRGATCLAKPRLSDSSIQEAIAACPEKFLDPSGNLRPCSEEGERAAEKALVFNKS